MGGMERLVWLMCRIGFNNDDPDAWILASGLSECRQVGE